MPISIMGFISLVLLRTLAFSLHVLISNQRKTLGHPLTKRRTQEAYEKAVKPLFASLDRAEAHLAKHAAPYYYGANITEADVRLYTTIVRFDPVYVQHFKCNIRDIRSGYPALHKWLRKLYWDVAAFKDTTQFEHIKKHYTKSHKQINPFVRFMASISCCALNLADVINPIQSITPVGPIPDILPKDEEISAAAAMLRATKY